MADDWYSPTAVANQALDAALLRIQIGDINDGTEPAQVCLRWYSTCMEQLLRSSHWDFARREAPLQLIADVSRTGPDAINLVPAGFLYSYSYPTDCQKLRFIPANYWNVNPPIPPDNIIPPDNTAPITPGLGQPPAVGNRLIPSRFLITNDVNYIPPEASNQIKGVSPIGQTVICSNIQSAHAVYTFNASYPNLWDSLFREAMVAYLASEIVMRLTKNDRLGLIARDSNMKIAQQKIQEARSTNGNESWASSDLSVDWLRVRNSGGAGGAWGNNWGAGPGCLFGGYDGVFFSGNSSAY